MIECMRQNRMRASATPPAPHGHAHMGRVAPAPTTRVQRRPAATPRLTKSPCMRSIPPPPSCTTPPVRGEPRAPPIVLARVMLPTHVRGRFHHSGGRAWAGRQGRAGVGCRAGGVGVACRTIDYRARARMGAGHGLGWTAALYRGEAPGTGGAPGMGVGGPGCPAEMQASWDARAGTSLRPGFALQG
jgi:hypothetical protein